MQQIPGDLLQPRGNGVGVPRPHAFERAEDDQTEHALENGNAIPAFTWRPSELLGPVRGSLVVQREGPQWWLLADWAAVYFTSSGIVSEAIVPSARSLTTTFRR